MINIFGHTWNNTFSTSSYSPGPEAFDLKNHIWLRLNREYITNEMSFEMFVNISMHPLMS